MIVALSALMPVYLPGFELNIRFSCIINDLYSAQVPSNGLRGFNLNARSWWAAGTDGSGTIAVEAGTTAARR